MCWICVGCLQILLLCLGSSVAASTTSSTAAAAPESLYFNCSKSLVFVAQLADDAVLGGHLLRLLLGQAPQAVQLGLLVLRGDHRGSWGEGEEEGLMLMMMMQVSLRCRGGSYS